MSNWQHFSTGSNNGLTPNRQAHYLIFWWLRSMIPGGIDECIFAACCPGVPDSKVHGANMGPIWGRQDPGGPHVGPMNFAIWCHFTTCVPNFSSNGRKPGIADIQIKNWLPDFCLFTDNCELKLLHWTIHYDKHKYLWIKECGSPEDIRYGLSQ